MEALRTYLNSLTPDRQDALASEAGTSIGYLRKAISIKQQLSPAVCVRLEQLSENAIRRWDLRPDDWWEIWPELIRAKSAPPIVREAA